LNWENPAVRKEVYELMRWWLDKGIDGFRMDTISLISKPLDFPDGDMMKFIFNGPRVHEYIKEMCSEVLSKYDVITVGETGGVTVDDAIQYANADGSELNMVFHFEHVELDNSEISKWTDKKIVLTELKEVLSSWQKKLFAKAWNSLYWCNHDQPRIVSRLGDTGKYREKSAKMLATCLHFMQGTPYIYQGEELGMTNCPFKDISEYRDLESINAYNALVLSVAGNGEKRISKEDMLRFLAMKSRDNSRTPMQWNAEPGAGFSIGQPGSCKEPWIMVNPNYREINAEEQIIREDSVFKYYQKLIQLRKDMDIITLGDFDLLMPEHPDLFVYMRRHNNKELLVACNFVNEERTVTLPEGFISKKILITNDDAHKPGADMLLGAFEAVVLTNH
jgi:oligo-1,6-glucosidase